MTEQSPPSFEHDRLHDRDVALAKRGALQAYGRIRADAHAGLCSRRIASAARWHLVDIIDCLHAGVLAPADAALEVMRTELAARDTAPLPQMPAAITAEPADA